MFKKILFAGVLLFWTAALTAKDFNPILINNPDEVVLNKLVADDNFRNYYISNVEFANKIIETGSGLLFKKYLEKKITSEEQSTLFNRLSLKTKAEFDNISLNLKKAALAFMHKFPELKQMAEKQQKDLLIKAFRKLSGDKMMPTFIRAKNPTTIECFWYWMVCVAGCAVACAEQPQSCYWTCEGICAGGFGLCWLWADE